MNIINFTQTMNEYMIKVIGRMPAKGAGAVFGVFS